MNKEIYNSTLGINESDVQKETDITELDRWRFTIKKDIININEKYDQNNNEHLIRENQTEKEAALAAHRALYAMKRQQLLLELIESRLKMLLDVPVVNA